MPELPEVETVRRYLDEHLDGVHVVRVHADDGPRWSPAAELHGREIVEVARRGKYRVLRCRNPHQTSTPALAGSEDAGRPAGTLVVHLGMSGVLTYTTHPAPAAAVSSGAAPPPRLDAPAQPPARPAGDPATEPMTGSPAGSPAESPAQSLGRHERFAALLVRAGGEYGLLRLVDPRGFGGVWWWPHGHPPPKRLAHLGPEPLDPPLTGQMLGGLLRGTRAVKAALLDQTVIVGVGNIYADEALHAAGIHPTRPAGDLSPTEHDTLAAAIVAALHAGLAGGGTTLRDYRRADGTTGENQQRLRVYGRAGSPCPSCRTTLVKSVVAARGTTWCPTCQPRPATPPSSSPVP